MFEELWVANFAHSPLDDLADEYHRRCEAYDRIVCTGPIRNGEILPASSQELDRINRHAHMVRREPILRAECIRQAREQVNHKLVRRLMVQLGLKSLVRPKKYRSWRGAVGQLAPNLLNRQFRAQRPNEKWVMDVTEFNVKGQKLYLSPVMDFYNGEIIAWHSAVRPTFDLVGNMLRKAFCRLARHEHPLLHSDQGWQYQMATWRRLLDQRAIRQSMSSKGNGLDNAAMESFFATLKTEFFYLNQFDSVEQLQAGLRQYIHYYNHECMRLKLKGLSPVQYRTQPWDIQPL